MNSLLQIVISSSRFINLFERSSMFFFKGSMYFITRLRKDFSIAFLTVFSTVFSIVHVLPSASFGSSPSPFLWSLHTLQHQFCRFFALIRFHVDSAIPAHLKWTPTLQWPQLALSPSAERSSLHVGAPHVFKAKCTLFGTYSDVCPLVASAGLKRRCRNGPHSHSGRSQNFLLFFLTQCTIGKNIGR